VGGALRKFATVAGFRLGAAPFIGFDQTQILGTRLEMDTPTTGEHLAVPPRFGTYRADLDTDHSRRVSSRESIKVH
jgi:hypothetical protein